MGLSRACNFKVKSHREKSVLFNLLNSAGLVTGKPYVISRFRILPVTLERAPTRYNNDNSFIYPLFKIKLG